MATLKDAIEEMYASSQPYRMEIRRKDVQMDYSEVHENRKPFTLADVLADDWICLLR